MGNGPFPSCAASEGMLTGGGRMAAGRVSAVAKIAARPLESEACCRCRCSSSFKRISSSSMSISSSSISMASLLSEFRVAVLASDGCTSGMLNPSMPRSFSSENGECDEVRLPRSGLRSPSSQGQRGGGADFGVLLRYLGDVMPMTAQDSRQEAQDAKKPTRGLRQDTSISSVSATSSAIEGNGRYACVAHYNVRGYR